MKIRKIIIALIVCAITMFNCSGYMVVTETPETNDTERYIDIDFRDAMKDFPLEKSDSPLTSIAVLTCAQAAALKQLEKKNLDAPKAEVVSAKEEANPESEKTAKIEIPDDYETSRYAAIIPQLSEADIKLMAAAVYQESNNQCFDGQQAVAEVILNRILNEAFPGTVSGVLYQKYNGSYQFSTAPLLASTTPNQTNIDAVNAALFGTPVLDATNVVFFGRSPENSNIAATIGAHYFCRAYSWG